MRYRVSWPRTDRKERRYAYKTSLPHALGLAEKLRAEGKKRVRIDAQEVDYGEWNDISDAL